mgnify:CR=1 FL=1
MQRPLPHLRGLCVLLGSPSRNSGNTRKSRRPHRSSCLSVRASCLRGEPSAGGVRQGLATTTVTGTGQVAVLSDGPLIALGVQQGMPVVVDPDAFVANFGQMTMNLISGISWKSLVGEGSGEPFSLRFDGQGTVFIQPAER